MRFNVKYTIKFMAVKYLTTSEILDHLVHLVLANVNKNLTMATF